ncbi:MAG: DUF2188 domain-containing protein [Burkholderiales bacterium]|jgi:hypothetical protein|nr:DUF2188 domain-containing protein [Burkholderiales bacterium]
MKTHHVVPHGDQWAVKKGGSSKPIAVVPTQKEGISIARPISQNQGSELFIHRPNGQIRDRDSHGNDPKNSKG